MNYNIYWSVNSGVNKNGTKISNATNPYIHTVLTNGTKYYYVITAQNIYGEGIISNEQSAVPYVLPLKPTNVIALGGVSQATISWDKLTGLTYNLYWSTTTGVTKKNGKKISNITSPYVHTELTNGTMYYYIVVAENSFGEGVVSSQVSVMPNSPPVSPSNVASLPGNSKITISWDKVTGLTYNIYWSTSSGVSKNYGTKISNATSPYTHTSLLPGTTYYYIVTASNIYGESVESNQVSTITSFIYLSDNFEYGTGNWFISGSWGTTTSDYYSYNKSITESPIGNYSYLANSAITMKNSINISNVTSPVLSFWHKHNTEYGYDYGLVDISKDNGQTWVNIKEFSGDSYFWIYEEIDLSLYKSSSFKLRFKFTSDTGINYDGWYIDDVEIK